MMPFSNPEPCPICFDDFSPFDRTATCDGCAAMYCQPCIDRHMERQAARKRTVRCPICNVETSFRTSRFRFPGSHEAAPLGTVVRKGRRGLRHRLTCTVL